MAEVAKVYTYSFDRRHTRAVVEFPRPMDPEVLRETAERICKQGFSRDRMLSVDLHTSGGSLRFVLLTDVVGSHSPQKVLQKAKLFIQAMGFEPKVVAPPSHLPK